VTTEIKETRSEIDFYGLFQQTLEETPANIENAGIYIPENLEELGINNPEKLFVGIAFRKFGSDNNDLHIYIEDFEPLKKQSQHGYLHFMVEKHLLEILSLQSIDIRYYSVYIVQTEDKELFLIIDWGQNQYLSEKDMEAIEEACQSYQIKAIACGIENKWKTKTSEISSSANIAILRINNDLFENLKDLTTDTIKHIADQEGLSFHQYRRFHNYVVSLINEGKLNNKDLSNLYEVAKMFKQTGEEDRW
jgi:hypothetical protein